MKKITFALALFVAMPLFSAGKMNISGQKNPAEVVEKDGIYTVAPQGRTRIQLFPKTGAVAAYDNAELEVTAEVSGSGNVQLGFHMYNNRRAWSGSNAGKIIRVDNTETETIKAVVAVNKPGIVSVLPLISVISGEVKLETLSIRLLGGLDKSNLKTAPILAGWSYNVGSAMKCSLNDGTLELITGNRQLVEMLAPFRAAKAGDKVKITGKITGKGSVSVGLHLYDRRRVWQGSVWHQLKVDGQVSAIPELTVVTPAGKNEITSVRAVIRVNGNSNISLAELKAE